MNSSTSLNNFYCTDFSRVILLTYERVESAPHAR
jgi:hypothetical protein